MPVCICQWGHQVAVFAIVAPTPHPFRHLGYCTYMRVPLRTPDDSEVMFLAGDHHGLHLQCLSSFCNAVDVTGTLVFSFFLCVSEDLALSQVRVIHI